MTLTCQRPTDKRSSRKGVLARLAGDMLLLVSPVTPPIVLLIVPEDHRLQCGLSIRPCPHVICTHAPVLSPVLCKRTFACVFRPGALFGQDAKEKPLPLPEDLEEVMRVV